MNDQDVIDTIRTALDAGLLANTLLSNFSDNAIREAFQELDDTFFELYVRVAKAFAANMKQQTHVLTIYYHKLTLAFTNVFFIRCGNIGKVKSMLAQHIDQFDKEFVKALMTLSEQLRPFVNEYKYGDIHVWRFDFLVHEIHELLDLLNLANL